MFRLDVGVAVTAFAVAEHNELPLRLRSLRKQKRTRRPPSGRIIYRRSPPLLWLPLRWVPLRLPPPKLDSRGLASFTLMFLPLSSLSLNCPIPLHASSPFPISTKPKPFDWP